MKRIVLSFVILTTMLIAKSQDLSNSIEYSQLYIVGAATSVGWSDSNALEMTKINHGVFKWQGELKANEEFKFINTRSWYKSILSASPDVVVELSKTYNLDFYAAWDLNGKDWKFKMPKTGNYCVIVDLNNMKMSVTQQIATAQVPSSLYVTGTAIDNQVVELENMYDVEFKKVLSCNSGNLLLVNTPTINENTTYYGPLYEDVDLTFGKGFLSQLSVVDKDYKGWSISAKGDYTIYVDKNNFAHQGRKFSSRKVLYIVGGCCELNWNYWDESNKRFFPNPENPAELIWEGELRMGTQEEPNKFKILTAESWTEETYHPYISDALAEGMSDARISGGDDLKWSIQKNGIYRLTLNTMAETLKAEYLGPTPTEIAEYTEGTAALYEIDTNSYNVYVANGMINVDNSSATTVVVCNLMGQTISNRPNHISGAVTGQLPNGIYLVTLNNRTIKTLVNAN